MDDKKNLPEETKKLSDLRDEINKLEDKLTEARRNQYRISEERSPTKSLYKWKAPERSFRPKSRNWYIWVGTFSIIAIVLSVLTGAFLLVVAIIAVLAVIYAMDTIPPKVFEFEILNKGLRAGEKLYAWRQIPKFWINERGLDIYINFELLGENQPRLTLLSGDGDINIIAKELVQYIDYLEPTEVKSDIFQQLVEGQHKKLGDLVKQDLDENPIKTQ